MNEASLNYNALTENTWNGIKKIYKGLNNLGLPKLPEEIEAFLLLLLPTSTSRIFGATLRSMCKSQASSPRMTRITHFEKDAVQSKHMQLSKAFYGGCHKMYL